MRKFFENIVDYPYAIIILIAFLCAFGIIILHNKIPVEREPDITLPYIMIHILYPGASPEEVESKITRKIENKLKGLKNLDYIESMSFDGGLNIEMKFIGNEDVDNTKREVEDIVNLVKPEFPLESEEPFIELRTFDDIPILLVSLTNSAETTDLDILKTYADKLKSVLEQINDVSYIDYYGELEHEIHVEVNPLLAEAYGLTIDEIAKIIQSEHQNYPAGEFLTERKSLLIKTQGEFLDLASIESLKIKLIDGSEVSLSQIAKIVRTTRKQSSFSRFNGKPSITLIVKGQDRINVLKVVDTLQKKITVFKQDLPSSIEINTIQDSGADIKLMIKQLGSSALYGALFVFILLVLMIGIRNAILVGFAIPFTILFSITFLYFFDFSINTITIFAMIVILGLVVDGAIIVSENIYRHIEEGISPIAASKAGIAEVGPSVFVADITTICAFLPIAFMSGMTGDYLIYLPITVILTIIGSMIIDHFGLPAIIPRLSFKILDKAKILHTFRYLPVKLTQRFRLHKLDSNEAEEFQKDDTKRIDKPVYNTPEPDVTLEDLAMTLSDERISRIFPELGEFYDAEELKTAINNKYYKENTTRRVIAKVSEEKPEEIPKKTDDFAPKSVSVKKFQNVRRWKLDYKGIIDASEDLSAALLEQMQNLQLPVKQNAGKSEKSSKKATGFWNELGDSFIQAIMNAKQAHDKGLVTSFWRKGEAPEIKAAVVDFHEDRRIIIPPAPPEPVSEDVSADEQLRYPSKDRVHLTSDTKELERDRLLEKASPFVKLIRSKYGIILNSLIKFRFIVFAIALISAIIAVLVVFSGIIGIEYIPHIDRSRFFVRIKMPAGTPINRTSQVISELESVLDQYSQEFRNIGRISYIKSYITSIGETNTLLVDLREYSETGSEIGKIQVELVDIEERSLTQYEIIQEIRSRIPILPDAEITVDEVFEGPPTGADISMKVTGDDLDTVYLASMKIKNILENIDGTQDVSIDYQKTKPILQVKINKENGNKFGINPANLGLLLRSAIYGYESGEILRDGDEIKIIVKLGDSDKLDFERLRRLPIRTSQNEIITLAQVVDFSYTSIPKAVRHYNQKKAISVRCNLASGINTKSVENMLISEIKNDEELRKLIPSKVSYYLVGETEERDKSFEELTISLFVGLMLIFFVLVLYFNSLRQAIIIILVVPLGFAGVIFGLYITDNTFNLMSFIGIVALTGIVVNDAIVLVDCIRDNRKKGFSLRNSVIRAGQTRLRPVILTTLTTIFGLIPLTLNFTGGGYFWQPLCIAIIFGIMFATLLTLIVIPLAYFELYKREVVKQRIAG